MNEMILLVIGFIVVPAILAFLICSKFKHDMQTAVFRTEAGQYVDSKDLRLRHKRDVFTHTTETREKINKENK